MTPDSTLLPPLGEDGCRSCATLQANAVEYVTLKHRFATQAVAVTSVRPEDNAPDDQQFLRITLHQLPASVVDEAGAVVSAKQESTFERRVLLSWRGDRWLVFDIG